MTPAEKLARYLDDEGETVHAEIVRRLSDENEKMSRALVDAYSWMPGPYKDDLRERHADALRDVKDMP